MRETRFERSFIKRLESRFPGCVVIKGASQFRQGIPDRILLWENRWAMLEFKESRNAPVQPNQSYYVEQFGNMSFASFVCPENQEEVLDALQRSFSS